MKDISHYLFLILIVSCQSKDSNDLIGSWCECQRDGVYKEYRIWENHTITALSGFEEKDYDDGISFFNSKITDTIITITSGLNVDLVNAPEKLTVDFIYQNRINLTNQFGVSKLTRLEYEIPDIDSSNLSLWRETYLKGFIKRAEHADCQDIRTDEEKEIIDLGEIEIPEFEDIK